MEYYHRTCRNCGTDCDQEYCSLECMQEYESGLGDYLYEKYKDSQLDEMLDSVYAHELINRGE